MSESLILQLLTVFSFEMRYTAPRAWGDTTPVNIFNLNYQYIIMKLHLPIALLAAVLSTMAYGEVNYVHSTTTSEDGQTTITSTLTGDATQKSFFNMPDDKSTPATGIIVNMPHDVDGWTATNTVLNIGDANGTKTAIDTVIGSGVRGTEVLGNKTINIYKGATVGMVVAGYQAWNNDGVTYKNGTIYGLYPTYVKYESSSYTDWGESTVGSTIDLNVYGNVGQILGHYVSSQDISNKAAVDYASKEALSINVNGGNVSGDIYAGGFNARVDNKVSLTISDGASTKGIYGGVQAASGAPAFVKSVHIKIEGDNTVVDGTVCAGGAYNTNYAGGYAVVKGDTLVEINGGTLKYHVQGGGQHDTVEGNTTIILRGGTIVGNVYGGGRNWTDTAQSAIVEGDAKVVIAGTGTDVQGVIYGGGRTLTNTGDTSMIKGDRILAFDNYTANTGADGYAQVKWVKDDGTQQYQGFNALEVSNGKVNLGTISSEYDQLAVSNGSAKLDKLIVGADKSFDINGSGRDTSSVIITGAGANTDADNEETFRIGGKVNVSDTTFKMQNSITQLAIGNENAGAEMTISNSYVDLREAGSVIVGYDDYTGGKLTVTNGSTFLGAYNNAWLLKGEVEVSGNSVMEVCNTGSSDNYRTLIGSWLTGMKITVKDSSSFTSGASQLVLNYGSQHDVTISVQGEGSTFIQKEYAGNKESVTYICNAGIESNGKANGPFNNVSSTIEAIDGGKVDIQSKTTYIGDARDKGKYGENLNKTANFVVGKDSSISFRQMEVYADTNINFTDASGVFSATGVNLYDGATMNIEKAGSISLGDVAVGDGAKLNVSGTTLVFTEGADITVAYGGSLTLDNVAFELVLGDVSEDYSLTEYKDFSVTVMSGLENLTDENDLAFFKNLESANLDISIKGLVDGKLVDMNTYGVEFVYDQATGTASIKGSASIPEPTTATLSLLALAALAARRRRK